MKEQLQQLSEKYFMQVLATRRLLHARPELAYEEFETAALVAKILNELGFEVTANIAKTGVVALLKCRDAGSRCVALRADMDALPITEQNETDYKSKVPGQMHACGHDVHTASLLGVAMILSELRSSLTGTYKFIFQPSEEKIPSGAEAMIKEGVLHNPAPDVILGLNIKNDVNKNTNTIVATSDCNTKDDRKYCNENCKNKLKQTIKFMVSNAVETDTDSVLLRYTCMALLSLHTIWNNSCKSLVNASFR
jgi:amidohydrolase